MRHPGMNSETNHSPESSSPQFTRTYQQPAKSDLTSQSVSQSVSSLATPPTSVADRQSLFQGWNSAACSAGLSLSLSLFLTLNISAHPHLTPCRVLERWPTLRHRRTHQSLTLARIPILALLEGGYSGGQTAERAIQCWKAISNEQHLHSCKHAWIRSSLNVIVLGLQMQVTRNQSQKG